MQMVTMKGLNGIHWQLLSGPVSQINAAINRGSDLGGSCGDPNDYRGPLKPSVDAMLAKRARGG